MFLAILGVGASLYLTYAKLTSNSIVCGVGSCDLVQSSKYSEILGIPVAVFGAGFYFLVFSLIYMGKEKLVNILLVWGVIYSIYLTYLELFVIYEVCSWCVGSFVIILLLSAAQFIKLRVINKNGTNNGTPS